MSDVEPYQPMTDLERQLLAELQSRSRTTLCVIRSLLRKTARGSLTVEEFSHHVEGRLGAYGRAQLALSINPLAGGDLATLLVDELVAHAVQEGRQVEVRGPEVRLRPRAAELMALVFNELILNSIKFGALAEGTGRVDAHWMRERRADGSGLSFTWRETSVSRITHETGPAGFGTELIEKTLRQELGADTRLECRRDGMECSVRLPPDAMTAHQATEGGDTA